MDEHQTRQFFCVLLEGADHLVERTIGLNFLGFAMISLCVSDLGAHPSVLPRDLSDLVSFFSVLLIWMALHHGFALDYASLHFNENPGLKDDAGEPIFAFPGEHSPVFLALSMLLIQAE